jgi:hypothetical protein
MSEILVKALHSFAHGALNLDAGNEAPLPEATARDLEGAGLVMVMTGEANTGEAKQAPEPQNKMRPDPSNKGEDAGDAPPDAPQPSSAPTAPAPRKAK